MSKPWLWLWRKHFPRHERRRPLHVSWIGITLPVDDPWWRSHYPPNGWNCKCSVRQVADRERERILQRGGSDKAPPIDLRDWHNKRTGATERVPAGIDPGWQTNAGLLRDRTLTRQLQGALDRMPETARREAVKSLIKHPVFEYVVNNRAGFIYPHPAGDSSNQAKGHFGAVVATLPEAVQTSLKTRTSIVRLSVSDAAKQLAKRKRKDGTPSFTLQDYHLVQELLDTPEAIEEDGGKWRVKRRIGGKPFIAIIKPALDATELFLNSFRRDD